MNRAEDVYINTIKSQIPKDSMQQVFIQDLKPLILTMLERIAWMAYNDAIYKSTHNQIIPFEEWFKEEF